MPSGGSRRAPRRRRRVSWLGRSGLVVAILAGLVVLGGSLWSTRELIVEETGPPTALAAEPLSPTSVELEWKPAEDVDRYVVRVGPERSLTRGAVEAETRTMLGRMAAINTGDVPIVYAGDFNSGRHRAADSPGTLKRGAGMVDTVDAVTDPVNRQFNTGHTFSTRPLLSGAHVDHIFASKGLDVLAWEQLVRMNGSSYASPVLSDHNALRARLALEAKDVKIGAPTRVVQVPLGEPTTAPGAAP